MVGAVRAFINHTAVKTTHTAAKASIEWVKTSGVRNIGLRTLDSIAKIADRMGFSIHDKGALADLIRLSKPAKPLFSFFETVTKTIPIFEALTKRSYNFALRDQVSLGDPATLTGYSKIIKEKTGLEITLNPNPNATLDIVRAGYIPFNIIDRTCAVAYAVADWLSSYGDWVEYRFRQSADKDAIHWNRTVDPWIGRIFYTTNMWAELRVLLTNRPFRNKENTNDVQGELAFEEKVSSYVKIGLYAMFIAMDILGQIKPAPGSTFEKVNFWIQRVGINIGIPLAVIIVPKLFTESLRNRALDI